MQTPSNYFPDKQLGEVVTKGAPQNCNSIKLLLNFLMTGLIVCLFFSRFLSLDKIPLGLRTNHFEWFNHGPYLSEVAVFFGSLTVSLLILGVAAWCERSRLFWILFPILVSILSFGFCYLLYFPSHLDFVMNQWANAGYPMFGNLVANHFRLYKAVSLLDDWVLNNWAVMNDGVKIGLEQSHVATHPPGGWVIYWFLTKILHTDSMIALGYAKIILNLVIYLITVFVFRSILSKRQTFFLSIILLLSPAFIYFGTDPTTSLSLIYLALLLAMMKAKSSRNPLWGIVLGVLIVLMMATNFINLWVIPFVIIFILDWGAIRKSLSEHKWQIYLCFIVIVACYFFFKILGYDYFQAIIFGIRHNYSVVGVRIYEWWFWMNFFDIFLFTGLGTTMLVILAHNLEYSNKVGINQKVVFLLYQLNLLFLLLINLSGATRGEAGRIFSYMAVPAMLFLSHAVDSLISNKRQFLLAIFLVSLICVYQLSAMMNNVLVLTGPDNLPSYVRTVLNSNKVPGSLLVQ